MVETRVLSMSMPHCLHRYLSALEMLVFGFPGQKSKRQKAQLLPLHDKDELRASAFSISALGQSKYSKPAEPHGYGHHNQPITSHQVN